MALDGLPIVRANINIDADHLALADEFEQCGHEYYRTAARDACLYDDVWLGRPYNLLGRHNICRHLDDRDTHPAPQVRVIVRAGRGKQVGRRREDPRVVTQSERLIPLMLFELCTIV